MFKVIAPVIGKEGLLKDLSSLGFVLKDTSFKYLVVKHGFVISLDNLSWLAEDYPELKHTDIYFWAKQGVRPSMLDNNIETRSSLIKDKREHVTEFTIGRLYESSYGVFLCSNGIGGKVLVCVCPKKESGGKWTLGDSGPIDSSASCFHVFKGTLELAQYEK